jgi:NAD+ kinase
MDPAARHLGPAPWSADANGDYTMPQASSRGSDAAGRVCTQSRDATMCAMPQRIGVVVHPSRDVDAPVQALERWAATHGVALLRLAVFGEQQFRGLQTQLSSCDLVVAIGGDGTTLAAIRVAAAAGTPVMGIACGSLGVLTTVAANRITPALERFRVDTWQPRPIPALAIARDDGTELLAFNDVVAVRGGQGQVRTTVHLDDVLYARFAGDGWIVSTPVGSSAYGLASGGPLLAPGTEVFALTPLPTHGGFCPPLVAGPDSRLRLDTTAGYGGARLEVDGQVLDTQIGSVTITLRPGVVTIVDFAEDEPLLTGLRRRQIIIDSPRILAEDARATLSI